MIPEFICAAIALYAALRILFEKRTLRKLPYLNVFGFAIAGYIALLSGGENLLYLLAAVAFFVGSTLESNAIASAYAGGDADD